jgi:chromosome segregation ATPase
MTHSESKVHRDPQVEELVEELRDRVAFLERALERRSVEAERYQQIVASLTQTNNHLASRLREIEAPQTSSEAAESVVEEQDRAGPGPVPEALRRAQSPGPGGGGY